MKKLRLGEKELRDTQQICEWVCGLNPGPMAPKPLISTKHPLRAGNEVPSPHPCCALEPPPSREIRKLGWGAQGQESSRNG